MEKYVRRVRGEMGVNLTESQLGWWRMRRRELGVVIFRREYPSFVGEAFLAKGRMRFEGEMLENLDVGEPLRREGEMWVWEEPRVGESYVVGVDVAEGLGEGDFSVMEVLDSDYRQVGEFRGRVGVRELVGLIREWGEYYNGALVVVESNNHGFAVLELLGEVYGNLYVEEGGRRLGWQTNVRTKPLVIDGLERVLMERVLGVRSERLRRELGSFRILEGGGTGAARGCHDDLVMAMAMAVEVRRRGSRGCQIFFGGGLDKGGGS